jgi:hypothetical protein
VTPDRHHSSVRRIIGQLSLLRRKCQQLRKQTSGKPPRDEDRRATALERCEKELYNNVWPPRLSAPCPSSSFLLAGPSHRNECEVSRSDLTKSSVNFGAADDVLIGQRFPRDDLANAGMLEFTFDDDGTCDIRILRIPIPPTVTLEQRLDSVLQSKLFTPMLQRQIDLRGRGSSAEVCCQVDLELSRGLQSSC